MSRAPGSDRLGKSIRFAEYHLPKLFLDTSKTRVLGRRCWSTAGSIPKRTELLGEIDVLAGPHVTPFFFITRDATCGGGSQRWQVPDRYFLVFLGGRGGA